MSLALTKRAFLNLTAASAAVALAMPADAAAILDTSDGPGQPFSPWRPGELIIHHISTGRGNATYVVAPDGTSLLLDAGEIAEATAARFEPLKLAPARPDGSLSAGEWIVRYIQAAAPVGSNSLDFAVISHFHADHFGDLAASRARSADDVALTGITEVGARLPIGLLLDRVYPDYASVSPGGSMDPTLANYARFVDARAAAGGRTARIRPGREQIGLRHDPDRYRDFVVHVLKVGPELADPAGGVRDLQAAANGAALPENALSVALVLSYGGFRYFAGADNTGVVDAGGRTADVETPMAAAVGPVDAMSLNHHGGRDANNAAFLAALNPQIVVQQSYMSDQPGQELVQRLAQMKRSGVLKGAFATNTMAESLAYLGPPMARTFTSLNGHVVIRVAAGGGSFRVIVLDDGAPERRVRSVHGPYPSGRRASGS